MPRGCVYTIRIRALKRSEMVCHIFLREASVLSVLLQGQFQGLNQGTGSKVQALTLPFLPTAVSECLCGPQLTMKWIQVMYLLLGLSAYAHPIHTLLILLQPISQLNNLT